MDFSTIKFFNTSKNELYLRHICLNYFLIAIHSISTFAFLGNAATSKQLRAGYIPVFRGLHHECLEAILRKS